MMMDLLTGLAVWMAAAVALGLLIGRAMHGYGVTPEGRISPRRAESQMTRG